MQAQQLARVVAAVLWADEKDTPEEWAAAEQIFNENKVNWEEAKPLIEEEIEALIDEGEGDEEETEEELDFGAIDLGPDVDSYQVLCGLADLACSDSELAMQEIEILHQLGSSMNIAPELVSAALVRAAASGNVTVAIDGEV
tara:strand:- start:9 stop:434 length:426 start_codon:yes stop_codon:yes gene_type:complete